MKGLGMMAAMFLAVAIVACGGSEDPTKRPPEAESQLESQAQAQPNARTVATPQQPTAREMATPQRPTEAPTKSTAATPSPTSTSAAKPTLRPQRPTEPTSTTVTIEQPQEDPDPSHEVEDVESSVVVHAYLEYDYPPSLDMQIFAADIVVVATLVSVTAAVEADGDLYLPVQSLRFRSSQYLKGTGPTEFVVEAPIDEFEPTIRSKALENAQATIALRNTEYDSRPGVLFLEGPLTSATANSGSTNPPPAKSPGSSTTTTTYNFVLRSLPIASWEYSIDTIHKVWAPAKNTASSPSDSSSGDRSASNTNPEYIIDGKTDPPTTITLTALESRISEITAEINQGADIAGHEDCIGGKYSRENVYQDHVPLVRPLTVSSGTDPLRLRS